MNSNKLPGGKFVNEAMSKLAEAKGRFQTFVDKNTAIAKKYADKGQSEIKTRLTDDFAKIQKLIDKERKDLEALQRQIPKEMNKLSKFLVKQTKEVQKVLTTLSTKNGTITRSASAKKSTARKGKVATRAPKAASKRKPTTPTASL